MEKFFEKTSKKLYKAIKKDAKRMLKEMEDEELYSVAVITDSDCITLYMAMNTYEYLESADEDYLEMVQDDLTEEDISLIKDGKVCLTKWIPDEWGYSDGERSELNKISGMLYEKEKAKPEEYATNKNIFLQMVISVFKDLINDNVFKCDLDQVTFFVSLSDGERIYEIENYSAKILNSEKMYEQFINRKELGE